MTYSEVLTLTLDLSKIWLQVVIYTILCKVTI